jgi:RNA polymerase sigma-70 factor, ECF subfamily
MGRFLDALLAELSQLPEGRESILARADTLETLLVAHITSGQTAWPGLALDPERFVRFLARRLPQSGDLEAELNELPAADLYLTCACADGDARAIVAFEARYFRDIDATVAGMRAPNGASDDVKQILRTRFFVSTGGRPPAITEFGGRGNLHGWVRVSAVREVLRLFKRDRRKVDLDEALLDDMVGFPDPEMAAVKAKCKTELGTAFRASLAGLSARERTLLRYHIADGLSIDAIGSIYHVHRATAARWLAAVRERLVSDTQARLAEHLRLDRDEVESVIRLVRSQLDLSIVSLLGSEDPQSP